MFQKTILIGPQQGTKPGVIDILHDSRSHTHKKEQHTSITTNSFLCCWSKTLLQELSWKVKTLVISHMFPKYCFLRSIFCSQKDPREGSEPIWFFQNQTREVEMVFELYLSWRQKFCYHQSSCTIFECDFSWSLGTHNFCFLFVFQEIFLSLVDGSFLVRIKIVLGMCMSALLCPTLPVPLLSVFPSVFMPLLCELMVLPNHIASLRMYQTLHQAVCILLKLWWWNGKPNFLLCIGISGMKSVENSVTPESCFG